MNTQIKKVNAKKLIPLLLTGAIIATNVTGCSNVPKIEESIEITLEKTKTRTKLDDIFTDSEERGQQLQTLDEMLEKHDALESIKIKGKSTLTKEEKEKLNQISVETVKSLIELYQDQDLTEEARQLVEENLKQVKDATDTWLSYNVTNTSIDALKTAVKVATCDAVGIDAEDFNNVKIDAPTGNYTELGVYVEDIDKHYRIKDNSIYGEMIHIIYNLQQHPLEDKAIKYGKQAVNLIKVSAYSEPTLSENTITSSDSYKEIKEKIKNKKARLVLN